MAVGPTIKPPLWLALLPVDGFHVQMSAPHHCSSGPFGDLPLPTVVWNVVTN